MDFHTYWYLGLCVLSLLLLTYIYFKIRSGRLFLVFGAIIGFGYIIESIIYCFLHSYQYYPHMIPNPDYDGIFGAIASNAFCLPISALFIAVFRKKWPWFMLFIMIISATEWLFLYLDIYKHNWWRTYYTAIGLVFYYLFAKKLCQQLSHRLEGFWHFIILFLIAGTFFGTVQYLLFVLFSNRFYQLGWFKNVSQDTVAFAALYYLAISLFTVIVARLPMLQNGVKYLLMLLCIFGANQLLILSGILHSETWWDRPANLLLTLVGFFIINLVSKHLSAGPPESWTRARNRV